MKHQKEKRIRSCALCTHAVLCPTQNTKDAPPLLLFLKADGMSEQTEIRCPYKKNASPATSCRRFIFDPLKYRPKPQKEIGTLDEDSLLLD